MRGEKNRNQIEKAKQSYSERSEIWITIETQRMEMMASSCNNSSCLNDGNRSTKEQVYTAARDGNINYLKAGHLFMIAPVSVKDHRPVDTPKTRLESPSNLEIVALCLF